MTHKMSKGSVLRPYCLQGNSAFGGLGSAPGAVRPAFPTQDTQLVWTQEPPHRDVSRVFLAHQARAAHLLGQLA